MSLSNDRGGELSVLGIAIEGKLVLRLAIGNFVNLSQERLISSLNSNKIVSTHLEPLDGGTQKTREVLIYIRDIVDL